MSKVVRGIVGVGLIVAGIFMGGSTWPLAVMALGGGIASTALQPKMGMPAVSEATSGRLHKSLEPEAFRKIAFGRTALATDTRYWEAYGPDQSNYDEVIALAGHKIASFDALYIEDELVSFDGSGNATGKYAGALSMEVILEGVSGTSLTGIGAGARWNVEVGAESASMTGIAHIGLKWVWSQDKLPRGFPTRITPVGKGAMVYDPRRDTTRGGSGSHRCDTENRSTWEHLPTDSNGENIGRNPALQILHYLLGWYVWNNTDEEWVLVHGMGVDPDDIDFDSFITAANNCEAEGYYADCLLSTGDNHATNLGVLEQACAGKVSDASGLYQLRIQVNDFGGTLTEFTDDDIVGECDWQPERPLAQSAYNQIAGQFIDPDALYQLRPLPLMRDPAYEAEDGEKARTNVRLDAVQDGDQGQKLLRLRLNKSRRKGMFEAPFGWRAVNVEVGQPVELTLSRFGFVNRTFRVRAKKTDPGGAVWMALESDGPEVYTGGTVLPVPPAGAGAGYDPNSVPTPGAGEWTGTGGAILPNESGGVKTASVPAITISAGEISQPAGITGILVHTSLDSAAGPWVYYDEYPPGTDDIEIVGLLPESDYYIRITYRNAFGVLDPSKALVLGPFTTDISTSSDSLSVGGRPSQEIFDDFESLAGALMHTNAAYSNVQRYLEKQTYTADGKSVTAALLEESYVRADADSAFVSKFALLGAENGDGSAWILDESKVKVGSRGSLGTIFNGINTAQGENAAAANLFLSAFTDGDGNVLSKFALEADANGNITGIYGYSDQSGTRNLKFLADSVAFGEDAFFEYVDEDPEYSNQPNIYLRDKDGTVVLDGRNIGSADWRKADVLTKAMKLQSVPYWQGLIAEKAGLVARATALSLSSTAYANAVDAMVAELDSYDAGQPDWDDLTGDTTIDSATLMPLINTVESARDSLKALIRAKLNWGDLLGTPGNIADLTGTEAILNSNVTLGGLGFTGDTNATVGAVWGSNLTGRPGELTDGRVAAGLASNGDIARNIPGAIKTGSDILSRTGGGTFTGALAATVGADWASNLSNRPTELTDGRVSTALNASGVLQTNIANASQIPSLPATQIGSGTFNADRVPTLDAAKIGTGTFAVARVPDLTLAKVTDAGDLASKSEVATTDLAAGLEIKDGSDNLMLSRSTGKLYVDGYEVNRLFTSSPGSQIAINSDDNGGGKVIARADLLDVRAINTWGLIGSGVDFDAPGVGTMDPGTDAYFKFRVWATGPDAGPHAIGTTFAPEVAIYQKQLGEWDVSFDESGNITILSADLAGSPVIDGDELNEEVGTRLPRYPSSQLGTCYVYFVCKWVSTTHGSTAGISLKFSTDTTLAVTNLINRAAA